MRDALLVIGAGGHARACLDVIACHGGFHVDGLIGMPHEMGRELLGCKVIGTDGDLKFLRRERRHALIGVGQVGVSGVRARIYAELLSLGFLLPAIISPLAYVSPHATVGAGTIVMHGAIVNAGAQIGENCIVNSRALVEHDVEICDHCHVATGAVVNGGVRIGVGSLVGSGCTIMQGVTIGESCALGMGLALRRDLPDGTRFVGEMRT